MSNEQSEELMPGDVKEGEPTSENREGAPALVAQRARPRHKGPSMVENRLEHRQAGYRHAVEANHLDTRAYHKPGSLNRHKC